MKQIVYTPNQLGKVLNGIRKSKDFSQQELGDKVGLLQKTVSALESAPHKSSIESLYKYLSAIDAVIAIVPKSELKSKTSENEW